MQAAVADHRQERVRGVASSRLFAILFALAYASVLTGLPLMEFKDRANYLTYASSSLKILQHYAEGGWPVLLTNEPLWLLINVGLSQLLPPELVLRAIIFLPAFVVSYLTVRSSPRNAIWAILFLLVPQVLKNHITHLRQGLAVAVFLCGWFSRRRGWRLAFFSMVPFIHSGFFFVLGLMALVHITKRLRLAADLQMIVIAGATGIVGVGLPWLASYLGSYLGARQFQQYVFAPGAISGIGFLFWGGILALMLLQPRRYLKEHAFEIGTIMLYLALYPFVEISARVFENTTLLVLLAGLRLTEPNRRLFLTCVLAYAVLTWGQRLLGPGPAF